MDARAIQRLLAVDCFRLLMRLRSISGVGPAWVWQFGRPEAEAFRMRKPKAELCTDPVSVEHKLMLLAQRIQNSRPTDTGADHLTDLTLLRIMDAGAIVNDKAIRTELRLILGQFLEELVEIVTRLSESS